MNAKTIPELFWDRVESSGEGTIALRCFDEDEVQEYSWHEYGERAALTALGFIELGLKPKEAVAIIGGNRHEWLEADLGVICAGGVSVPIYVTLPPEQIRYIINHSQSKFIIVENAALLDVILNIKSDLPQLEKIIVMENVNSADQAVLTLDNVRHLGEKRSRDELKEIASSISPEDIFTIVYTSGTTGYPKGAMISHHNMLSAIKHLIDTVGVAEDGEEYNLSFLPLAHIAERMLSCFISVYLGATTCFGKGLETLPEDLKKTRPTIFFAVPRLYEKFYEGIQSRLENMPGFKGKLARWATKVGGERVGCEQSGQSVPLSVKTKYGLAQKLVFSKLKEAIGFDRIRVLASGAAPIKKEILEFFHAIDIPVREIYGQTETCAVTTIHRSDRIKLGNVGQPFPGIELKIAEDGEILIRGSNVFKGYFNDPEATAESFDGEWFHTGDIGLLDEEGYLTITDRKKDLIITAGGKNIAPQPIENLIKSNELISNAVVIGDRRPYLTAIFTLDQEALISWADQKEIQYQNFEELASLPEVKDTLETIISEINTLLGRYETIKKWTVLPQDFTIESGELTPTLKVKRHVVNRNYAQLIDNLYQTDMNQTTS